MTRVTILALLLLATQAMPATQQPVFRATETLVHADVAVTKGNAPVAGLTAEDFEVVDNGVPQKIESVAIETAPIDLTLVVDLSGSVVPDIKSFRDDVRKIGTRLRPADRIRLVSFSTTIEELAPMQPASMPLPVDELKSGGATRLNDAVLYGLAWPEHTGRRHLVVVFTDGEDTSSVLDEASLPAVASRSNALLHLVLTSPHNPASMSLAFAPFVGPNLTASRDALIDAARQSGGDVHRLGDAVKAFDQILEDFRRSYVIYYTPSGVERSGWHDISVRVVKPGAFAVRARKGYFVAK